MSKERTRRFSKPQIAQESPRQREQPKEPFKSESTRNKRRNRVRAVNKHLDSSTESETSSEEDYVYTVENKSDPKTRAKIRVNSVEINFIVDTGATVDVIDSKTYDRLKSSVKLCKSTTKIFAYGSNKPLPLKGEFQATVESNKRYTVSVIHVVEGGSGNLLSAKTAQDLALIQLVNKVTELETPPNRKFLNRKLLNRKLSPYCLETRRTRINSSQSLMHRRQNAKTERSKRLLINTQLFSLVKGN